MGYDWTSLPQAFKGEWSRIDLAIRTYTGDEKNLLGTVDKYMRDLWAEALIEGNLKAAHKLWGKWQSFQGNDPWEDEGWRNFWELQKFGETLWDDFDAASFQEKMWLKTFISVAPQYDRR